MNQLVVPEQEDFEPYDAMPAEKYEWVLKKLKPVHVQICALLGQGLKNTEVAMMTQVTPEYVSMLLRQPIIKQEVARISEIAGTRLELLFEKSVDTIAHVLENGNNSEKLKAVRIHGELTKRIGRPDPYATGTNVPDDRLEQLASRLEGLLTTTKAGLYDEAGNPIFEEAEIVWSGPYSGQSARP